MLTLLNEVFYPIEEVFVVRQSEKVTTEKREVDIKQRHRNYLNFHKISNLTIAQKKQTICLHFSHLFQQTTSEIHIFAHLNKTKKRGGGYDNLTPCCHHHGFYLSVYSYLHTKTSTGSRVLGVMIQGATLNTTLSVKMGVAGSNCQDGRQCLFFFPHIFWYLQFS